MAEQNGERGDGNPAKDTTTMVTPLTVEITSFSYKQELPELLFSREEGRHGGGFVFDCRSLPNPGREAEFKTQTGLDRGVIEYLERSPEVAQFSLHVTELVGLAVRNYLERQFALLSVAFGCTGGQHRSVFLCERMAEYLRARFPGQVIPKVYHYNLTRIGMLPPALSAGSRPEETP